MLPSPASRAGRAHGPRRRTFALATGLALIANLSLFTLPQAMATADPLCDEVPTKTWVLPRDIDCSGGGGLTVTSRSGVTIDLNGHTITGTAGGYDYGISVYDSRRVKILNGAVTGFDTQIYIDASSSVTVDNVLVSAGPGSDRGISVTSSTGIKVNNSVALGASGGEAFYFQDNVGNLTVSKSSTDGYTNGIFLRATEADLPAFTTTLSDNVIVRSSGDGIYYEGLAGTLVATGNVVLDAYNGIGVYCNASFEPPFTGGPLTITGNRVLRSSASGFFLTDCLKGKSTISGNVSAANQTGFYGSALPNATWSGNRASGNDLPGFEIYEADGSTFKSNRADANGSFGFDISDDGDAPPAAIDANFSRGNDGRGFYVESSGDLTAVSAGNVAFGNGDGTDGDQCVGVTCVGHADVPDDGLDCGDPVPASVVLSEDLKCSLLDGPALTVPSGASRVTIDLNGYTISPKSGGDGILIEGPGPTKSITIKNGYIDGGSRSIFLQASDSSVTLVNLFSDAYALLAYDEIEPASGNVVNASDVGSSGGGYAISTVTDTSEGAPPSSLNVSQAVTGALAGTFASNVLKLDRSVVLGYGSITAEGGSVVSNSVIASAYGLQFACSGEVGGSVNMSGTLLAPFYDGATGAQFSFCTSGKFANNLAVGNDADGFLSYAADGMAWTGNRAFGNGDDGFEFIFQAGTATVKGNFAEGNAGDGFYVVGSGAGKVFSSNFARGNGYIGFESHDTELNGSGNIAFGNGSDNCVNVICKLPA